MVGRRPGRRKKAAFAQAALHGHERHENHARRAKIAKAGKIVLPIRIDDDGAWQNLRRLVMIEDDRVEAEPCRLGKRRVARLE